VACMLTVVTSLRAQNRNVLAYLTQASQAARQGKTAPSLLPTAIQVHDVQVPTA